MRSFFKENGAEKVGKYIHEHQVFTSFTRIAGKMMHTGILMKNGMYALRRMWEISRARTVKENDEEVIEEARTDLMRFAFVCMERLAPCIHYLCNHLIEDYMMYKPLGLLICEGGEAANSRDGSLGKMTVNGRQEKKGHPNSFNVLMSNHYCAYNLIKKGSTRGLIFSSFMILLHQQH